MRRTLVSFAPLSIVELSPASDGRARVELTRKFVDGLLETKRHWDGELVTVHAPRTSVDTNLDQRAYTLADLPFRVVVRPYDADIDGLLREASLVMLSPFQRRIAAACRRLRTPYCVVAEYNLSTRISIASEEPRVFPRAKRMMSELVNEVSEQRIVAHSAGLQCNGAPTYDAWASLSKSPMLYFDTRVSKEMLASDALASSRGRNDVLKLAFSGRFVPMKGVLHLPEIAKCLRERGVRFEMRIFGAGAQEHELRARIAELDLANVTLEGNVPFAELVTRIKETDLFVCPHVQGDPSCTYLETLGCAVPIAGFANDAWRGILQRVDAGWSARIGDHDGLAAAIATAAGEPGAIARAATNGLAFARGHTFDETFARRGAHLMSLVP